MENHPIIVTRLVDMCIQVAQDNGRVTYQTDGYNMTKIDQFQSSASVHSGMFLNPAQILGVAIVSSNCIYCI
jgi:hypothetical protein